MNKKELLKCLCNPLEKGIWELEIKINPKDKQLIDITGESDSFFMPDYFLELLRKILEENTKKREKAYEKDLGKLKDIGLLSSDDKGGRIRRRFLGFSLRDFDKEGFDLKDYQFISKEIEELKGYVLTDFGEDSRELVFVSLKDEKFFKMKREPRGAIITSFHEKPIQDLKEFIGKFSKNISFRLKKKYYPENLIYSDYMLLLLNFDPRKITDNENLMRNFYLARKEFLSSRGGKNESSIRFIGLAMEEILAEMYGILLRDRPPKEGLKQLFTNLTSGLKNL